MLIQDYLRAATNRSPGKDVLIFRNQRRSYEELLQASESTARWLAERLPEPGFRAAILSDDPFDYVVAYFGTLMAGGVAVGLNIQTSDRNLQAIFDDCRVSALITDARFAKHFGFFSSRRPPLKAVVIRGQVDESWFQRGLHFTDYAEVQSGGVKGARLPQRSPADVAQIIYTSGTTGAPKGVMLSHSNLVANTDSIIEYLHLTEADRVMAVLPFFYSYGNSLLLTHIAAGGSLVVNQHLLYPVRVLDEMSAEQVTGFSGVPSTFAILLNRSPIREYRFPNLRYLTQAGGPMSPAMALELRSVLPEVEIFIMYGQTEASARLSYLEPGELERKSGSIGKAIPGVTLEVLDPDGRPVPTGEVGEIVASGANIMSGYWRQPEASAEVVRDGALWTGDLARKDKEGYLYIVGRKSDMIKSGSHRIGPKEIEDVLIEHGSIHEAAVLGIEDEILGEAIKAFVVLKPGYQCSSDELLKHCRRLLPAFKVPREFECLSELPKTATGKVKKAELREQALMAVTA